jgi:hypothetical protein
LKNGEKKKYDDKYGLKTWSFKVDREEVCYCCANKNIDI